MVFAGSGWLGITKGSTTNYPPVTGRTFVLLDRTTLVVPFSNVMTMKVPSLGC
jgi:hypothetical protein